MEVSKTQLFFLIIFFAAPFFSLDYSHHAGRPQIKWAHGQGGCHQSCTQIKIALWWGDQIKITVRWGDQIEITVRWRQQSWINGTPQKNNY